MKKFLKYFLSILVLLLFSCSNQAGASDPLSLGEQYLQALQIKDKQAILQLVAPDHEAQEAVSTKLALWQHKQSLFVSFTPATEGEGWGTLMIQDEEGIIHDELYCAKQNGRWYLILGDYTKQQDIPETTLSTPEG